MYSCGPPHMDVQEWDDQHELTYSSYVRTRDVALKTCRRRWMIGRNGERRSGISAQAARHDDDDIYTRQNLALNDLQRLICYKNQPTRTLIGWSLTPLQTCSLCILQPQLTGQVRILIPKGNHHYTGKSFRWLLVLHVS